MGIDPRLNDLIYCVDAITTRSTTETRDESRRYSRKRRPEIGNNILYCNVKSSSFIKTEPQVADSAEITDLTVDEFVTKIFELSSNHLGETSVSCNNGRKVVLFHVD